MDGQFVTRSRVKVVRPRRGGPFGFPSRVEGGGLIVFDHFSSRRRLERRGTSMMTYLGFVLEALVWHVLARVCALCHGGWRQPLRAEL